MNTPNYEEVREELIRKNLYDIQRELTLQRRSRTVLMSLLLFSLVFTVVFGTLEDPIANTLSRIGNFYNFRVLFIAWAIISGISIEVCLLALFKLEKFTSKSAHVGVYLAAIFLIATGLIPAFKDLYPILHAIHVLTSILYGVCLYIGLFPFSLWISRQNPRLRIYVKIWQIVIWAGSILLFIFFQVSGIFEMWFFTLNLVFLLYLSLVLFEEKIIKISMKLLTNEENINLQIEKVFVNLEAMNRRISKEKEKKQNT